MFFTFGHNWLNTDCSNLCNIGHVYKNMVTILLRKHENFPITLIKILRSKIDDELKEHFSATQSGTCEKTEICETCMFPCFCGLS